MTFRSNWRAKAICASDRNPEKWLSYETSDLEYARDGCKICQVKRECLLTAIESDDDVSFVGMTAGVSEYEYLLHIWKEVENENESNWATGDSAFSILLQQI